MTNDAAAARRDLFLRAIAAPALPETEDPLLRSRLDLYRGLVRRRVFAVLRDVLPRTSARLDALKVGGSNVAFAKFMSDPGPKSPVLRDVVAEFAAAAESFLFDPLACSLLAYETSCFQVLTAPSDAPRAIDEPSLTEPLPLVRASALLTLAHAVHEGKDDPIPATAVLIHRDDRFELRTLVLGGQAARLVGALSRGVPLASAVKEAEQADGVLGDALLASVAHLLADLSERGVFRASL